MEDKLIQILIQGGLTSVALVSLYFNFKIVTNHIQHNTDVMDKLTNVLSELKQLIQDKI